ncbi:MAG: thioredoxin [Candidatus Latescibacteria bacterium]|nr:thioredoxin [Candidatus Latescibacterota bacterium]
MSYEVTDFNTDVIEKSHHIPVLVDFWAEWCGPCRQIAPAVDEVAAEYEGRAVVGKVNIDHHPDIASQYGIRSIPNLLVFSDGKVQQQIVGAVGKGELSEAINKLL